MDEPGAAGAHAVKRFCKRGHDQTEPGMRYRSGRCVLCQRARNRKRYLRQYGWQARVRRGVKQRRGNSSERNGFRRAPLSLPGSLPPKGDTHV